ncbi:MAG: hypothetical protein LLG05_11635 [Porphyromonadaceae bacterium]|nr:hypothetical protein [Porphyromonadaceae bacterium]
MKAKYFFGPSSDEMCYDEGYWYDYMFDEGLTSLVVCEARVIRNADDFWCASFHDMYGKGGCGKECKRYAPRNGKNGICKHNRPVYEKGNKVTLKISKP